MGGLSDAAGPAISYGSKNKYRGGLGAGSADAVGQGWDTGTGSATGEDVGVETMNILTPVNGKRQRNGT
ncbi:hypothetical protein V500_06824 [Pseudogymnoascus sp. VKM F-4518 (FW-2643)]|nr:hypothetical protein V500_06824 [Pseudogymnoascus sp. VKM F-4518 (FW-2643)]